MQDYTGFRDKPSGVVLLEDCTVKAHDDTSVQKFSFIITHTTQESVVLAAESEKDMLNWMQAVRISRITYMEEATRNEQVASMPFSSAKHPTIFDRVLVTGAWGLGAGRSQGGGGSEGEGGRRHGEAGSIGGETRRGEG